MADVAPMKVPEGMSDEQALFLSDILPTGWQAAENAGIATGDTVAIWGAGPVGLFAIKSAQIMGAEQIVAIDDVPVRLEMARRAGATHVIDFTQEDVLERLKEITKGQGPDSVIDCVGMEAHAGHGIASIVSTVQEKLSGMQRPYALEEMITAVRPAGTVSVPGVYGGPIPVNMGSVVQKGLTIKSGQTHVKRYLEKLSGLIQDGTIDPTFLITHRSATLDDGPELYKTFRDKKDDCVKVVFHLP
jgi:threonine dehydrogenase-like Zn-dependent dehydrogenase